MDALHPLLLVGIGAGCGYAVVNLALLLWLAIDLLAAGEVGEAVVWPDPDSLTVWTGEDRYTVTVMPVAFGRWGLAVCRDSVPRRPEPLELVERARTERDASDRARELAGQVLSRREHERVALVAR